METYLSHLHGDIQGAGECVIADELNLYPILN